ncbi:MAG: hypothetical protein RXQ62_07115 [Nitrososphaeria archaeon]
MQCWARSEYCWARVEYRPAIAFYYTFTVGLSLNSSIVDSAS